MFDRNARNERLRAMLRQGDPKQDGRDPSTVERVALRRLVVDAARSSSTPVWGRLPVLASALTVVALVAIAVLIFFDPVVNDNQPRVAGHVGLDQPAETDPTGHSHGDAPPPSIRNVQFVTKGGTRIVWVLNRNLNI